MAAASGAEWLAAYVETRGHARLPESDRVRAAQTLGLAERLGARTITLTGRNVADELVAYARETGAGRLVVGKPAAPRWREALFGSVVNELVRKSGDLDVYVMRGDGAEPLRVGAPPRSSVGAWRAHVEAASAVGLSTAIAWLMFPHFERSNLVMVYLLGVALVAARSGRRPSVLASVLSVASFDFFFVPPYLTFRVADTQYLVTFAVMLVVALVISTLTVRVRQQAESARQRERRTAVLYAMSRELASLRGVDDLVRAASRHVGQDFMSEVGVFLPDAAGRLVPRAGGPGRVDEDPDERAAREWAFEHGEPAGVGNARAPRARALYLPLLASRGTVGVLGIRPRDSRALPTSEQLHLLETLAAQTALAVERATLAEEAQQAQLRVEAERLRSTLLSSVSHDLRTPLATITGSASALAEGGERLDAATRTELARAIHEEADRLSRLVHDLLDMTRLESGTLQVRKDWHPLEEVVGAALGRLQGRLANRPLRTALAPDLPLVPLDAVLIEQVLINLLENAIKYTPAEAPIEVAAAIEDAAVAVSVADRGPGLLAGDEDRVFDKFYRGPQVGTRGGVGLGLTVCRGMVEAHGGHIVAENRPGGGVVFRFTLPLADKPPEVPPSDD